MNDKNIDVAIRPPTISEMFMSGIGDNSIESTLRNHTYLISGPFGTGKTTTARAMAKFLFTGEPDSDFELDDEPCYIEMNSTKFSGKDDIKLLVDSISEAPMARDKIIVVLDEAQGLTSHAQSVLLKPIEEPPPHLYIILCTTEPNKIRKDVRDRCSRIDMKLPSVTNLVRYSREYAIPKILDTIDSKTLKKCNSNIEKLSDSKIKDIVNNIHDVSYRGIIRGLEHFILTGTIPQYDQEEAKELSKLHNVMIYPNRQTWRKIIRESSNIDNPDEIRKYLCNYIGAILRNKMEAIDIKLIQCYSYAINMLKDELSYSCPKADLLHRISSISINTINTVG